jgi:hypothetical protein
LSNKFKTVSNSATLPQWHDHNKLQIEIQVRTIKRGKQIWLRTYGIQSMSNT